MGFWKEHQLAIEERGYGDTNKVVCAGCIGDPFISNRIRHSHKRKKCSFCGAYRNVLPLEDILELIVPVIRCEYEPALVSVPYDSETKGYSEPVLDPFDFVHDELNEYLQIENEDLLQELVDVLEFEDRVSSYKYSLRPHEEELAAWDEYCKLVKKTSLSAEQIVSSMEKDNVPDDIRPIHGVLTMVYTHCKKMNLAKVLYGLSSRYKAHDIYRCVNYLPLKSPYNGSNFIPAASVGTAPAKFVSDNRMSEAGDMMFYGADCKETAMAEVGKNGTNPATIGIFHPNKRFRVLDLTGVSNWSFPSIFDAEHSEQRNCWLFLREFAERISGEKDGTYKPTQVLTKYIQRKTNLQGIMYNSSKVLEGNRICYVLFVTNSNCLNKGGKMDPHRNQLVMDSVQQMAFI